MSDCEPLIDAAFLALITGADVSDTQRVDALIQVTSTLIGEIEGACLVPATAPMRIKVVCAQFVADQITTSPSDPGVRAEQVGDYRVEYARPRDLSIDDLRRRLRASRPLAVSISTFDKPASDEQFFYPDGDPWE